MINHRKPGASRSGVPAADSRGENKSNAIHGLEHIRKVTPLRLLLLLRTTYSAATGSTQPLKMSAQAGGRKRTRTDLERGGAPTEADAATASTEQEEHEVALEALEAELAAVRADRLVIVLGNRNSQSTHDSRVLRSL